MIKAGFASSHTLVSRALAKTAFSGQKRGKEIAPVYQRFLKEGFRAEVRERVEELEALGDGKATRTLYKSVLKWNLKNLGLNSDHRNAIYDFVDYHDRVLTEFEHSPNDENLKMQVEKLSQMESILIGITANKHKATEKELSYTTDTFLAAFNYSAFNTAQFGTFTAIAAGAAVSPVTAPVLACLSLVCAGVYYKQKIDLAKLPKTVPEQMRQEEIFINSVNLLTNTELLSDIPEDRLSAEQKDNFKEAMLILAGVSQKQQDEMSVRAAFAMDQLEVGAVKEGLDKILR